MERKDWNYKTYLGDCIDGMRLLPAGSVDFLFTDLPYGRTNCKWDTPIDLDAFWSEADRIVKKDGAVALFAQTPFDKVLGCSNLRNLRYEWIWEKSNATGHLNAKKMPMRAHENILIFYRRQPTYNPQKTDGHQPVNSYTHYIDTQNRTEIYQKATKEVKGGGNTDRYLAECNHAGGGHVADVRGPYKTITAKHTGGIVAPSLIQYHTEQTENVRASGLGAPIPTVDASNRYGLTCANLVKYYSGVVGEKMEEPLPTVTAIDHNAVCAAHVVKFKGDNLGSSPAEPMQTVTAGADQKKACGGGTFALCDTLLCKAGPDENLYRWPLIRELLNRYCGYKLADDDLLLLSIGGTLYFIADIGLRMLSPRELYNAMGFPPDYIIDRDYMGNPHPKNEQVARCGNAVCPPMAAAVARANFPEYVAKVGDTITTMAALLDMVAV